MEKKPHKNCIPIVAIPVGHHVGTIYQSMLACAQSLDLQVSHISECCAEKRDHHKGYTFRPLYYGYYERKARRG